MKVSAFSVLWCKNQNQTTSGPGTALGDLYRGDDAARPPTQSRARLAGPTGTSISSDLWRTEQNVNAAPQVNWICLGQVKCDSDSVFWTTVSL